MHLFVSKFNEFQSDRLDQEGKEKHVAKLVLFLTFEIYSHFLFDILMHHG